MKSMTGVFLKGLFTLLPLIFSIYVLIWFLALVEGISRSVISLVWPDSLYLPGMGIAIVVVIIFASALWWIGPSHVTRLILSKVCFAKSRS